MFNKLKVKVAEEVKNSHQRFQQFTQSLTEKVENAPSEESFFTIGDDDGHTSSPNTESGFSNVPLTSYSSTPNSGHYRRSSNTSIASDVSFLPHYESPTNLYHMQSDLDISASEVEDNASTSSQLGHLTKEQIYSAFQKAQQGYHKYRGRYTDVARHYKDLERENNKIRSVLVETQDKALRRISELREQCSLEQKAKAHLENSLRVDLDEKQYVIDSLKTKVDLLHTGKLEFDKLSLSLNETVSDNESTSTNLETLSSDLKDAKTEIESLTSKIQEMKANSIIFNTKEADFKKKIGELEEINRQKSAEISEILERERENNLIIAQTKMELHTEIQNRDLEIENLKQDVESLKSDLDGYETKSKNNKLENLQAQNTKLIEKLEELTQKCNNYESDLLKMEQFRIENKSLHETIEANNKQIDKYERHINEKTDLLQQQKLHHENELASLRESAKSSLLTLESKIKSKLEDEFTAKENALTLSFEERILCLTETDNSKETQLKLLNQIAETQILETKQKELEQIVDVEKERYTSLETNHLELISECSKIRGNLSDLQNTNKELTGEILKLKNNSVELEQQLIIKQKECSNLFDEKNNVNNEIETIQNSNVALQNEMTRVRHEIEDLKESNTSLQNENIQLQRSKDADNLSKKLKAIIADLQGKVTILQEEKASLENQYKTVQKANNELQGKIETLETNSLDSVKLNDTVTSLSEQYSKLQIKLNTTLQDNEDYQKRLSENEKVLNSNKIESGNLQKSVSETQHQLKEMENQKLDLQKKLENEKVRFTEELQNLNTEILKWKEDNRTIQVHIDEYKSKLNEYEAHTLENTTLINRLKEDNIQLKTKQTKLENLLDTSDSSNSNLKQQVDDLINKNKQILVLEELINKHIDDQSASLIDKIKLITELNAKLKEANLTQDQDLNNLDIRQKEILNENKCLKEQIEMLESDSASKQQNDQAVKLLLDNSEEKCNNLKEEITKLTKELESFKKETLHLQNIDKECQHLKSEKIKLDDEFSRMQSTIDETNTENRRLADAICHFEEQEKVYNNTLARIQNIEAENTRIMEEMSELKLRNKELSLDYKQITAENEEIVTELAETKLKFETISAEKTKSDDFAKKTEIEKAELLNELKQHINELDKLKTNSLELGNIQEIDILINDNKSFKLQVSQLLERCETFEKQQKVLEGQLREFENQYTELSHEKQLLQDEIQELKISPINVINSQKLDNLNIIHAEKILPLETPNDKHKTSDNQQREIDDLNEKLVQYKSLDLTNRTSIQFYENEMQKLKNKNEKLNRKLDETLVTLSHCAELSHSTETEYLKNVLYNYMLGKESVVLARVIAAVCKFDDSQTNTILQREQQKQSLLGQLGFL